MIDSFVQKDAIVRKIDMIKALHTFKIKSTKMLLVPV